MSDKLTRIAKELLQIDEDLPFRFDYSDERPKVDDFELYTFEQTWGSTALGFGGMGGQAMTSANTYVFVPRSCNQKCLVYFSTKFAYSVPYSDTFMRDVIGRNVASVMMRGKYFSDKD